MSHLPVALSYPEAELSVLARLEKLFQEWDFHLAGNGIPPEIIVHDGFYPYYTFQPVKILFIGREALGIEGWNYIDVLYEAYKDNHVGLRALNQCSFHTTMFYIAYSLNNNGATWQDTPYAEDLSADFASERGISFAFMNLSKLSNESESSSWLNKDLVGRFMQASEREGQTFWNKEIEILSPDLIITTNFGDYGYLGCLGNVERQDVDLSDDIKRNVGVYMLHAGEKRIPLLDTWHFSAPRKSPERNY